MRRRGDNPFLTVAAVAVAGVAVVHLVAVFIGPSAYRYLEAAFLAEMAEAGSAMPALLTLGVVGGMLGFAAYAWSGAGRMGPLPRLRAGLWVIGGIFTLRGLGVVWFTYLLIVDSPDSIPREIGFSLVALAVGLLYLLGIRRGVAETW